MGVVVYHLKMIHKLPPYPLQAHHQRNELEYQHQLRRLQQPARHSSLQECQSRRLCRVYRSRNLSFSWLLISCRSLNLCDGLLSLWHYYLELYWLLRAISHWSIIGALWCWWLLKSILRPPWPPEVFCAIYHWLWWSLRCFYFSAASCLPGDIIFI